MTECDYALVGDIGGTNARFALVGPGQITLEAVRSLPCSAYDSLDRAVRDYLRLAGVAGVQGACLAVAATPGADREVRMTNNPWRFDPGALKQQFGWRTVKVINDFTAMALGVLDVGAEHLISVCGGPGEARGTKLVIGPGTGLGVSALVPCGNGWVPLITEGGHVDFAPTDATEVAILNLLKARFGRVSAERLVSGPGLLNLYQAHADLQKVSAPLSTPEHITAAAIADSDRLAVEALCHFCELLGRVAGNAALTLGSTGGVYLCGGMLPQFQDFFLRGPFQQGFLDKGRMRPMLAATPVHLVTDGQTGLKGAARALIHPHV